MPLPKDGLRAVNVYLLVGASSVDLIDSGWHRGDAWDLLERSLHDVGAELGDVRRVIVTHLHHDHYGQSALIRRASGAAILLGAGERPSLETIISVAGGPRANFLQMLASSGADDLRAAVAAHVDDESQDGTIWEYPDTWLGDGMRIDASAGALDVIDTPGHTSGHVSFLDADAGLLFAGDHVLPHITPSIAMEVVSRPLPLKDFLSSLARVRGLPVKQVLPAHGYPFANLLQRVDELVAHHEGRLGAVLRAIADGASTAAAAARGLLWTRREVSYESLDLFNRQLAVRETLAHLDLLVDQELLTLSVQDGVRTYKLSQGGR